MVRSSTTGFSIYSIGVGLVLLVLTTAPAAAYVGPGAGLTAIGTVLGVVAALLLAAIGFIWYPVKRLLRHRRTDGPAAATGAVKDRTADRQAAAKD